MSNPQSVLDAIKRALIEGKLKVARELYRSGWALLSRIARTCLKRELSSEEFQDLLRQASVAEREEEDSNRAV